MSKNTAVWWVLMIGAVASLFAHELDAAVTCLAAAFIVTAIDDAIQKLQP